MKSDVTNQRPHKFPIGFLLAFLVYLESLEFFATSGLQTLIIDSFDHQLVLRTLFDFTAAKTDHSFQLVGNASSVDL